MTDLQKIFEEFVGRGKVQSLSLERKNGVYVYKYKEGRKTEKIESEDFEGLQRLHLEFGGRNPETCRAQDYFLNFKNDWTSDNFLELGHRPQKIKIKGERDIRNKTFNFDLPKGSGYRPINTQAKKGQDHIGHRLIDREVSNITRIFKKPEELDKFKLFILNNSTLNELTWKVEAMGTETKATGDQCIWIRKKAGDGTQRMVLQLEAVNSIHYNLLMRKQLHDAADDMFCAPCQQLKIKQQGPKTKDICAFAAEDGTIDLSGFIAAD